MAFCAVVYFLNSEVMGSSMIPQSVVLTAIYFLQFGVSKYRYASFIPFAKKKQKYIFLFRVTEQQHISSTLSPSLDHPPASSRSGAVRHPRGPRERQEHLHASHLQLGGVLQVRLQLHARRPRDQALRTRQEVERRPTPVQT